MRRLQALPSCCQVDEFLMRMNSQLGVDVLDMALRRVAADDQVVHDVAAVAPVGEQDEHLAFACGEAEFVA